jgi:hypothetical protein
MLARLPIMPSLYGILRKAAPALVVAASIGGCSAPHSGTPMTSQGPDRSPSSEINYAGARADRYDRAAPGAAISRALAGVDRATVLKVRIAVRPSQADSGQRNWLYVRVLARSLSYGGSLYSLWQADLVQGSTAEQMGSSTGNLADVFAGIEHVISFPNGSTVNDAGGAGDVVTSQLFHSFTSDALATAAANDTLRDFGLIPDQIRIFHPLQAALYVVAKVPTLSKIAGKLEILRQRLLGNPFRYEGIYLQLNDDHGVPIAREAADYRVGAGRLWVRHGLGVWLGTAHG